MNLLSNPAIATPPAGHESQPGPELSVVVPTFNERENLPLLVAQLDAVLGPDGWEVIFVDDDSPDGTGDAARALAKADRRVRVISRLGRRGLSSACVEGILASSAPCFAVMDADLQHDHLRLPDMVARLRAEPLDIVVGTRYTADAPAIEGLSPARAWLSRFGGRMSRLVLRAELSDPMSGFFAMRRASFDRLVHGLSQQGFKILLDIFTSAPEPLRFAEVPCRFHPRVHGESKLDFMVGWEFGVLVLDKLLGGLVPVRLFLFGLVGASGLAVHLTVLGLLTLTALPFVAAQTVAVVTAMTWNFFLNNTITYRDRRLRGWGLLRGLLSFYAVCSVGAVANIGVAGLVFSGQGSWWLAGLAGAAIGMVWNFAASSYLTWRRRGGG